MMATYYVLDRCSDGRHSLLAEATYNPSGGFRTYAAARYAMGKHGRHYTHGICRDDRLQKVKASYTRRNN